MCTLTIDNTRGLRWEPEHGSDEAAQTEHALRMYPNPNRGDQLYLQLDALEEGVSTVTVDILDPHRKRVKALPSPYKVSSSIREIHSERRADQRDLPGDIGAGSYISPSV